MKKSLLILLSLGLVLACDDDDKNNVENTPTSDDGITISPVITRATRTDFEVGDNIGLIIRYSDRTYYVTNEEFTYDGDLFVYSGKTFDGKLYWYEDENPTEFYAYYPYSASGAPATFSVASDQSSDGYGASDLITGYKADVTQAYKSDGSSAPVSMSFAHQMTKILFSFSNSTGSDIASVVVGGSIPTAVVDYENSSVEVDDTAAPADIKAQQVSETTWRAIVVPQEFKPTIVVTLADGTVCEGWIATTNLVAGVQYGISASVDEDGLTVNISDEYSDWTDEDVTILQPGDPYLDEHLSENYIVYHDDVYKTVTLSNGTTWMAQNMRYVPDGFTVSDDPESGAHIWYPYELDYDQAVADDAVKTSLDSKYVIVLYDSDSIEELGYLYDYSAVLPGVELTEDNYLELEDAQGICPNGWHIPNRAEWFDLVGYSNKFSTEGSAPSSEDALFWDAELGYATIIPNAIEQFNFTFAGSVANSKYQTTVIHSGNSLCDESYYGEKGMNYIWCSTGNSVSSSSGVVSNFGCMSTFTTAYGYGRLSLASCNTTYGAPLRCIRNHDIDFYDKWAGLLVRPGE